jgi:hypothetical protein
MDKINLNTPKRGRGRPPISLKNRLNESKATNTPTKIESSIVEAAKTTTIVNEPPKISDSTNSEIITSYASPLPKILGDVDDVKKAFSPISDETLLPKNNKEILEENTEIDFLEFEKGKNKLKISLFKKHNRMFRIQIFLNDHTEIRPTTYTGSSMALSFWNLLKESLIVKNE